MWHPPVCIRNNSNYYTYTYSFDPWKSFYVDEELNFSLITHSKCYVQFPHIYIFIESHLNKQ